MTDLSIFRVYEPHELRDGRYPHAWTRVPCPRDTDGDGDCGRPGCSYCGGDGSRLRGIKDMVREAAGHRCVRCGHPYRVGESGEWEDPMPGAAAAVAYRESLSGLDPEELAARARVSRGVLWSECDTGCTHGGPVRVRGEDDDHWYPPDPPCENVSEWVDTPYGCAMMMGGTRVQAAWRILTVHHLNEVKADCRWHNLVALCQRCHLNVQRRVKMDRAYPWSHSEWFRPYVAAHYAVKYGANPAPTREWTTENLDAMLALGRREESVERMPV